MGGAGFSLQRRLQPPIIFAAARTALCAYRAWQQSLTVDEAFTFNHYLNGPWGAIYQNYDANNHVLYSLLARLSIGMFGLSEFTLRLPSVLAGFFLILGIYCVLEAAGCSRWVRWTVVATLGLFPLILDFSVAARGYGLSWTLLVWAIYFAMRGRGVAAGILLGLAVSANLTMAFPALGLMVCPLALAKGNLETRLRVVVEMAVPAAAITAVVCYAALAGAHVSSFYVGEPTISRALFNLVFTALRATVDRPGLLGNITGTHVVEYVIAAVLAFVLILTPRVFRRSRLSLIPLVTLVVAIAELVAVHYMIGLNYPVDRIGTYLFVLLGLAWAVAASHAPWAGARVVSGALACVLALQFLTQFETRYFEVWPVDLPMKQVAQKLRDDCRGKPPGSVALSTTWYHQPALEFYRQYYRIAALQPVERRIPTLVQGFDYYVFNLHDDEAAQRADRSRLIPLLEEPISGVLLAKEMK